MEIRGVQLATFNSAIEVASMSHIANESMQLSDYRRRFNRVLGNMLYIALGEKIPALGSCGDVRLSAIYKGH